MQVSESACTEDFNLRSSIIAYVATHDVSVGEISARHKDQLAATDVKWSHGKYDTTIATAAASGQIVLYDLNRTGVELARLHEHSRQVHRLAFNPFQGALLLSGSQDATIRLWDLRALERDRSVMTCHSVHKYPGNNEGIRDLRWSPTEGVEFAACTDTGVIQRWDFQKPNLPLLKVSAHEKTCHSIDWHPDGKHIASGGADKNVKIWDFSSNDRRMKVCWQLRTPRPVLNVRWRPPVWSSDSTNPGNWKTTQLATSYDNQEPRIHVWDFRRPSIPSREIDRYDTSPAAMLWHSENLLWSVGTAGMFTQTDISFATKVIEKRSLNTMAAAPDGGIAFFSEQRRHRRISVDDASHDFLSRTRQAGSSGEKLGSSYSATDGSLEEPSLFSSSIKNRRRKLPSTRSSKSLAGTPPSSEIGGPVLGLAEAMGKELLFSRLQLAAYGRITGVIDASSFAVLARQCKYRPPRIEPDECCNVDKILADLFSHNAQLAAYTGQYRSSQSWRILALAIEKELKIRADRNLARRLHSPTKETAVLSKVLNRQGFNAQTGEGRSISGLLSEADSVRARLAAPLTQEGGSNMTTPLARPVTETTRGNGTVLNAAPLDEHDPLHLPEPAFGKRSPQRLVGTTSGLSRLRGPDASDAGSGQGLARSPSPRSNDQNAPHMDRSSDLEFHDMDHRMSERRAAMDNYRSVPRPLLRLENTIQAAGTSPLLPRFDRHDSNESFQMFSVSTDSSQRARSTIGSYGSSHASESSEPIPERWNINRHFEDTQRATRQEADNHADNIPPTNGASKVLTVFAHDNARALEEMPILDRPDSARIPIVNLQDMQSFDRGSMPVNTEKKRRSSAICIMSDFLPSSADPTPKPWSATAMIKPLIEYHLHQLSDSQFPTLLLSLLDGYIDHGIPIAMHSSILLEYHSQLLSHSLYAEAADLRNVAYPRHPDVFEHGTYGIVLGGPWCTVCNKPSKGNRAGFCQRCERHWSQCPICDGQGPLLLTRSETSKPDALKEDESSWGSSTLWNWCQDCGHGGHVGCLQLWWDDADDNEGGCATLGCLHDCVAGARRAEAIRRRNENKKAATVKGDDWFVGESRAVEKARGLIGSSDKKENMVIKDQSSTRGKGSLGMGSMGRSASGGKKVRLVVPKSNEEGGIGS